MSDTRKLEPFKNQSESFTAFRDNNSYYVDKTDVIRYLIESGHEICVCTRPRRFGKTLMLRMLQTFFEYKLDAEGRPVDNRSYFEGLKVMAAGENVLKHFGQYPVISVSFKDVWGSTYQKVLEQLNEAVRLASKPHKLLFRAFNELSCVDRDILQNYQDGVSTEANLRQFLGKYTGWLNDVTHKQVVVLLDEYDVPLQKAAIHDIHNPGDKLYDKIVELIGQFISAGFKSNSNLAFGIIAGCMRVGKESIFTGMNNPGVITVLDDIPNEYWGFTEAEVKAMLAYYGIEDKYELLERWYDGYEYSGRKVFNPWSLLNAIRGLLSAYVSDPIQAYWSMTSNNDIIDDMIDNHPEYREGLAKLMEGGTKWVRVYKDLSYRDLNDRPDAIWSFLLYTGYLKSIEVKKNNDDLLEAEVAIPNREILSVMKSSMRNWWETIQIKAFNTRPLANALVSGDIDTIEREFRFVLKSSMSVFDYNEAFYHGMTVGLLRTVAEVHSNDEYGEGRPDVVTVIGDKGIILELKCVTPKALKDAGISDNDRARIKGVMQTKLDEATRQIKNNEYAEAVLDDEPAAREVLAYAVCFCRKWCAVRQVLLRT